MNNLSLLIRATLGLYRSALLESFSLLVGHLWIILLVPAYTLILGLAGGLTARLGMVGGMLMFLCVAACLSSFLTIIGEAIAHQRVPIAGLGTTFGRYLWSIVSIFFVFWIVHLLLALIVNQNPSMLWLQVAINVGIFVLFNAVPELVYQGSRDGLGLLEDAVTFIRENTIEWLLPMAVLLAPIFLVDLSAGLLAMAQIGATNALLWAVDAIEFWLPFGGGLGRVVAMILASVLITWVMLFRGLLFRALFRSGRRQRVFEARMKGL